MSSVFDLIDDYDIPGLNQFLHMKTAKDIDKPDLYGLYPIEYVVSKFNPEQHKIKTHCIMIQILLNHGLEMDRELLTGLKEDSVGKTKELIECMLEMKSNKKRDRFATPRHIVSRTIQPRNAFPMPKSDYSDTELMQLENHAEKNGVLLKPVNHLALRIINSLERQLEQYGHYN